MARVTLDAGVLIAGDRNEVRAWALKRAAIADGVELEVPAGALAQAWRGSRSANLARFLHGCRIVELDEAQAKAAGELCALTRTRDSCLASVVVAARGAVVVTTDRRDIELLARAADVEVRAL